MESPAMLSPAIDVVSSRSTVPFVHRYYLLLKAHYFLFFSAFGVLYPVLNIILRNRGLSNVELSYINIIIPFLVFFTNPLMGFIADRSRRYLFTFNFVLIIVTILYAIMFIMPSVKSHNIQAEMPYDRESGQYVLDFCASQEVATKCASRSECGCAYRANCIFGDINPNQKPTFSFTFSMNSKNIQKEVNGMNVPTSCGIAYRVAIDEALRQVIKEPSSGPFRPQNSSSSIASCEISCSIAHFCHGSRYPNQMRYVVLYALIFVIATNLLSNTIALGASIGFASIPRADIFGEQRLWGTFGFGISAFAASRLYKIFNTELIYIILFSAATIICVIVTSFIHIEPSKQIRSSTINEKEEMDDFTVTKRKKPKQKVPESGLAALIPLLTQLDVIVFLSLAFIWGISYAGLDPYLYLYIDEVAVCASLSIVGWMSLVSAASEIVAFFVAGRVLKLLGADLSSICILLAFAIRFAGYYLIRNPYYLIFMETMHFFNFGILFVLIAQKAALIAPPGLSGTLQGVAFGVSFGLGKGVGLLIASFIYALIEPRSLFFVFSIFNLIAAVIYALYFIIIKIFSSKSNEKKDTINDLPKIVLESDFNQNEEPLMMSPPNYKLANQTIEQEEKNVY